MSRQQPKSFRRKRTARRGRKSTTCPTGKIRYRDKGEADQALKHAQRPDAPARRKECRSYFCVECKGHHLTSQPKR